jgi:acetyl/propionyl-CoA carboxylase alpha subunit
MRRALREYDVLGIKTTVPFFTWMLDQPDFLAARFHTSYLDDVLRAREGRPFTTVDEKLVDIAVIAAAIRQASVAAGRVLSDPSNRDAGGRVLSDPPHHSPAKSGWKARARLEGLRR